MVYMQFEGSNGASWVAAFPNMTQDQVAAMLGGQGLAFTVIDQVAYDAFVVALSPSN